MPTPVTITSPSGIVSTVSPLGELRVENPASQLFLDTFSTAALDTINRWTSTTGGTGSSVTPSLGQVILNGGTVANSFAKLTSLLPNGVGTFVPSEPGFLLFNARNNLQFPLSTTGQVNFGLGTSPATPTIATPITEFIGFEQFTDGKLYAVTYQTGSRVVIADLSLSTGLGYQIQNANAAKYFFYFRGDICYFCMNDKDSIVANFQTGASGPNSNVLPILMQVISNGSPATTLQCNAVSLGDTSHTGAANLVYNGFTSELQKSNTDANTTLVTLSAQGAATINSSDQINTNGKGVIVSINTTVDSAGAYTVAIQGKDVISGSYYTLTAPGSTPVAAISGTIAATGFQQLTVYPGITSFASTATLGGAVNVPLPRTWRVQVVVTTGPITATIGASVIN